MNFELTIQVKVTIHRESGAGDEHFLAGVIWWLESFRYSFGFRNSLKSPFEPLPELFENFDQETLRRISKIPSNLFYSTDRLRQQDRNLLKQPRTNCPVG